ncbi:MAG: vWA domain-containing protein [Bacteroidota bacterium]
METKNATYYHLILDKSGSMNSHYNETLEGLNEKLLSIQNIQKRNPEIPIYVSLTLFSDSPELVFENVPASELQPLTKTDYVLDGMTGLLDAVGTVVNRMEYLLNRQIRENNANAMVVIFTDGMENASRMYTYEQVGAKIKALEELNRWSFAFVGADMDAWSAARRLNFEQSKVYSSRKSNVKETMEFMSHALENSVKLKKENKIWKGF